MKDIAAVFLGFLLVIIFFWQNIFVPAVNITPTVGTNDLTDLNYPLRHFLVEAIQRGKLPLWASGISSGYPILAEGQIGALYPLNLIFAIFETMTSVNLTIVSSYFFIFLFSFLYFRKIGVHAFPACFGATIVAFSGFAATQLMHFGMLISFYLFLAQLWCLEGILRWSSPGGSPFGHPPGGFAVKRVLLMGILLGLSILGGHPQIIIYGLVFLFFYWMVFWFLRKRSIVAFFGYWLLVIGIGLGIGAGQILPQYELTNFSQRLGGLSSEDIYRFNFPANRLVNFIFPFLGRDSSNTIEAFQTNGWPDDERYVYLGVVGLLLLVVSFVKIRKLGTYGYIFAVAIIASLILALGNQTPFGHVLQIPPISFFRLPFRTFFLLNFAAGGLIAITIQALCAYRFERGVSLKGRLLPKTYFVFSFLFLLLFFDLFLNSQKLHPPVDANRWYETPKVVSFLKNNLNGQERVTTQYYYYPSSKIFLEQPEAWQDPRTLIHLRNLLPSFNAMLYGIPLNIGAGNAAGLYVNRYRDLEDEIFFKGIGYKGLSATGVTDSFIFLNRLMGVRYALITGNVKHKGLKEAFAIDGNGKPDIGVYELTDSLPRAFIVQNAERASPEQIKAHLISGDFNPREKIYVEEETGEEVTNEFSSSVTVKKYQDTEAVVQTNASSAGFLFLSDTYYPGWKAYVDRKEKKIIRANYAFRAVWVPEGKHTVLFQYKPASLYYGITISLGTSAIASLGIAALLFFDVRKKRQ